MDAHMMLADAQAQVLALLSSHVRPLLPEGSQLAEAYDGADTRLLAAAAAGIASLPLLLAASAFLSGAASCCRKAGPPAPPRSRDFSGEAASRLPRDSLVCHACSLALPLLPTPVPGAVPAAASAAALASAAESATDAVAKHRGGKRHRKAVEEKALADDERTLFTWERAERWVRAPKEAEEVGESMRTVTAAEAAARAAAKAVDAGGIRLLGAGVAMAVGHDVEPEELEGGDWRRVKGGASGGGGGGGGGKARGGNKGKGGGGDDDEGAGSGGAAVLKDILANMLHLEGSRNILEGLVVHARFLTPGAESQMLGWVDTTIRAGQGGGRLRGHTYSMPRAVPGTSAPGMAPAQSPAMLNFGCFYDPNDHTVAPARLVEPLPPQLADLARRVAARREFLCPGVGNGGARAVTPDSATVLELLPGNYVSPHVLHEAFEKPCYILALGGDEDMLLGLQFEKVAGARPGDFSAGFVHRFNRRSLLAFRGTAASMTRMAIPAVSGRIVLIILRIMGPALRSEMEARGNSIAPPT